MELPETWKRGKKGTYHHHDGLLDLESKGEEKRRCNNNNKDCYDDNLLLIQNKLLPNKRQHLENGCLLFDVCYCLNTAPMCLSKKLKANHLLFVDKSLNLIKCFYYL